MDCHKARSTDPNEWVATCPPGSKPIAEKVREWVRAWAPDLEESIKWNMLAYSGRKGVLGLSGCLRYLGITFFRGAELPDPAGLLVAGKGAAKIRTARIYEGKLPEYNVEALKAMVAAAVALDLNDDVPPPRRASRPDLPVPEDLAAAFRKDAKAAMAFDHLSPTCKREYVQWITGAKRPETRAQRVVDTLIAVKAGKVWLRRKEALGGKGGD